MSESGGTGRRARLRGVWFTPYGFKSRFPHQKRKDQAVRFGLSFFCVDKHKESSCAFRLLAKSQEYRANGIYAVFVMSSSPFTHAGCKCRPQLSSGDSTHPKLITRRRDSNLSLFSAPNTRWQAIGARLFLEYGELVATNLTANRRVICHSAKSA